MMVAAGTAEAGSAAVMMANMQFAMSALTIGAQYMGQQAQQEAIFEHQEKQSAMQRQVAADAARHQYEGMLARGSQAKASAAMDIQNAMGQYLQTSGAARAAAAGGGVMGTSVDEVTRDFASQYEEYAASRAMNLSWEENQIASQMEGIAAQQEGRNQASIGDPIAMPSPLVALSQMGSSAFDAAAFWGTPT